MAHGGEQWLGQPDWTMSEVVELSSGEEEDVVIAISSGDESSGRESDIIVVELQNFSQSAVGSYSGARTAKKSAFQSVASGSGGNALANWKVKVPAPQGPNAAALRKRPVHASGLLRTGSSDAQLETGASGGVVDPELSLNTFTRPRVFECFLDQLNFSTDKAFAASAPDELQVYVEVALTIPRNRINPEDSRRIVSDADAVCFFHRDPVHQAVFTCKSPDRLETLIVPEPNETKRQALSTDLQLEVTATHMGPGGGQWEVSYAVVAVDGQFVVKGSSAEGVRGIKRNKTMSGVRWDSFVQAKPAKVSGITSKKEAEMILEQSLRLAERSIRREHEEWARDIFEQEETAPRVVRPEIVNVPTPTTRRRRTPMPPPPPQPAVQVEDEDGMYEIEDSLGAIQIAPPRFARTPAYKHIEWAPRAVPLEYNFISAYPKVEGWEDPDWHREQIAEFGASLIDLSHLGGDAPTDPLVLKTLEEEQLEDYVDTAVFSTKDTTTTRRDFLALRDLIVAGGFSKTFLDKHPWALNEADIDAKSEEGRKLLDLLSVYQTRIGSTAAEVCYVHEDTNSGPLIPRRSSQPPGQATKIKQCTFCGSWDCQVHPQARGTAFNFPPGRDYTQPGPLKPCGRQCFLEKDEHPKPSAWTEAEITRLKSICAESPKIPTCYIANEIGKPCFEIGHYRRKHSLDPVPESQPRSISKPYSKFVKEDKPWIQESQGYAPCNHPGVPCSKVSQPECACFVNGTRCSHACNCDTACLRRHPGCKCTAGCGDNCRCRATKHQCDGALCGCDPDTCSNSAVARSEFLRTAVANSKIPGAGFGLALLEDGQEGDLVSLYAGEWIWDKTDLAKAHEELPHGSVSYQFIVDQADTIDSIHIGNKMRFMNGAPSRPSNSRHDSRADDDKFANCVPMNFEIAQTHQMGLFLLHDVEAGTELTFDYGDLYPTNFGASESTASAANVESKGNGKGKGKRKRKRKGRARKRRR